MPSLTENGVATKILLARSSTSTTAAVKCTSLSQPGCDTGSSIDNNPTIIAVSVVVPVCVAIVVLWLLHRRHIKRLAREDAQDAQDLRDYGLAFPGTRPAKAGKPGKSRKGMPEMTEADFRRQLRGEKGLSMDLSNPFFLPPELQHQRGSAHSIRDIHDPYRPASPSLRAFKLGGDDTASLRTMGTNVSGGHGGFHRDASYKNLLGEPQITPISPPPPLSAASTLVSPTDFSVPPVPSHSSIPKDLPSPPPPAHLTPSTSSDSEDSVSAKPRRSSSKYLSGFVLTPPPAEALPDPPAVPAKAPRDSSPRKSRQLSTLIATNNSGPVDPYDFNFSKLNKAEPTVAVVPVQTPEIVEPTHEEPEATPLAVPVPERSHRASFVEDIPGAFPVTPSASFAGLDLQQPSGDRPLSILPPLPPDDPADNPEERALRIRSFYKEYFSDDNQQRDPMPNNASSRAQYFEDYDSGYMSRNAPPFAENAASMGRRAMTPPPRGAFQGQNQYQNMHQPSMSMHYGSGNSTPMSRGFSTFSDPAFSAPPRPRARPPKALKTLPTPGLISHDSVIDSIEFAPQLLTRDRVLGRTSSGLIEPRPFSPTVSVASPLASSYNELAVMPSPHQLRNSGLFTNLDFAPPARFKNDGGMSDRGSIRSGKSTTSAMTPVQMNAMRNGAYRVSRIPKELVGTQRETMEALRPTWKVGS